MPSYTNVNWVEMTKARDMLNLESSNAVDENKKILTMREDAAMAWTGRSGDTWRGAVDRWIDGFNRVIENLDNIRTTLENEIQLHQQSEDDDNAVAGGVDVPA